MTVLKRNQTGGGYNWPIDTTAKMHRAMGKEPAEVYYEHGLGRALNDLISEFRSKPVITALIEKLLDEVDLVEQAHWQVRDAVDIDLAQTHGLLKLGRLIQADTRARFSDDTLRAILDNHAQASQQGLNWADMQRWLEVFFESANLVESEGAYLTLALDQPTAVYQDIALQKVSQLESYVEGDTAPIVVTATASFTTDNPTPTRLSVSLSPDLKHMFVSTGSPTFATDRYELGVPGSIRSAVLRGTLASTGRYFKISRDGAYGLTNFATTVQSFLCSTPFEIETAVAGTTQSVAAQVSNSQGLCTSPEGDRVYVMSATDVYSYTLSDPADPTTAIYDGASYTLPGTPLGFAVSQDGEFAYHTDAAGLVYQTDLATAFNLGGATADGSVATSVTSTVDVWLDETGTKLFTIDQTTSGSVFCWDVPTAYDVAGAPLVQSQQAMVRCIR
jgi:hypothetical protein